MPTFPDIPELDGHPGWGIYRGTGEPMTRDLADVLPPPPPWRAFDGGPELETPAADAAEFTRRIGHPGLANQVRVPDLSEIQMVNAAIYLRRPLLVTGVPGTGKSSLAYLVARELNLGPVLRWPITTRTMLRGALYDYDAIGRVQAASLRRGGDLEVPDIGEFVRLGPLGTALLPHRKPRVLLIDEIDKSDVDLPNDLLGVFEDGEFEIPELSRVASTQPEVTVFTGDQHGSAVVRYGRVRCREFPIVVITSNGEREFPPAFLRRCLRLEIPPPNLDRLAAIVAARFPDQHGTATAELIRSFAARSEEVGEVLPVDHLLNALYLVTSGAQAHEDSWRQLMDSLWRRLSEPLV